MPPEAQAHRTLTEQRIIEDGDEGAAEICALEHEVAGLVATNTPSAGGFIMRRHAAELPGLQLELSRAALLANAEKRARVVAGLGNWRGRVGRL